jgi:uncharacterized protein (DUF1501 family)
VDRRHFLGLAAAAPLIAAAPPTRGRRVVILIELGGGNDGLNTVIPYRDPAYARARPRLAIASDAVLPLGASGLGLHPALEALRSVFDAGDLAVVPGLGVPAATRSHFTAIRAWNTGGALREAGGWVPRALGEVPVHGVVLGGEAGPLEGPRTLNLGRGSAPIALRRAARLTALTAPPDAPTALKVLIERRNGARSAAARLADRLAAQPPVTGFVERGIGQQLALAARMILADAPIPCLKLRQDGFDTHARQAPQHRRLLEALALGLAQLRSVLRRAGRWDDVLVMTYAEFGRRVAQNASGGTDHGAAAAHLVLGGRVRGGLMGAHPSLTDLVAGDLRPTTDPARLWATARTFWGLRQRPGGPAPFALRG